jgi:hypothetical protein
MFPARHAGGIVQIAKKKFAVRPEHGFLTEEKFSITGETNVESTENIFQ